MCLQDRGRESFLVRRVIVKNVRDICLPVPFKNPQTRLDYLFGDALTVRPKNGERINKVTLKLKKTPELICRLYIDIICTLNDHTNH